MQYFTPFISLIKNKKYLIDLLLSTTVFLLMIKFYFHTFVKTILSGLEPNPIPDSLLDALPAVDLDFFATPYIYFLMIVFALFALLKRPQYIPFYIKTFTLLYFSKFIILPTTHLTSPEGAIFTSFQDIYYDLFFSGHTAFPFMLFLFTRNNSKYIKYFFLASTLIQAATVLLMKVHYTIDVYAAPFIAFGIYHMSLSLFKKNKDAYVHIVQDEIMH